ncbi:MAG: hypothetical protein GW858_09970 [Sphingomonadales bacterium]|nr:hypothetical protein [Sphingomonadales bacterium]NCT04158.1 hypothetical protein [Sphingomonadales bacterium]
MSIFSIIGCALNLHQPNRRDVKWDGRAYVGRCRHCDAPIERLSRRKWRKRDAAPRERRGENGET